MNRNKWIAATLTAALIFVVTLLHDAIDYRHAFIIGSLLIITILKENGGA